MLNLAKLFKEKIRELPDDYVSAIKVSDSIGDYSENNMKYRRETVSLSLNRDASISSIKMNIYVNYSMSENIDLECGKYKFQVEVLSDQNGHKWQNNEERLSWVVPKVYYEESEDPKKLENAFKQIADSLLKAYRDILYDGLSSVYNKESLDYRAREIINKKLGDLSYINKINITDNLGVRKVTLLGTREAMNIEQKHLSNYGCYWLNTAQDETDNPEHNRVICIDGDGKLKLDGQQVDQPLGIRPVIEIANLKFLGKGEGDKIKYAGHDWTIIRIGNDDPYQALCDDIIGDCAFRDYDEIDMEAGKFTKDGKSYPIEELNNYEKSNVKSFVENWAIEQGILTYEQIHGKSEHGDKLHDDADIEEL